MSERRERNVTPKGREAHRETAEAQKAGRWGGAVKTVVATYTLPEALVAAVKAEAKRSKRPAGAVLCGLLDPKKVTALP